MEKTHLGFGPVLYQDGYLLERLLEMASWLPVSRRWTAGTDVSTFTSHQNSSMRKPDFYGKENVGDMATSMRPEVSEKNPYYIDRERYYELKHFCLQYPIWKKAYLALDGLSRRPADLELFNKPGQTSDPTARCAESREFYSKRMELVEQCAHDADPELYRFTMEYATQSYVGEVFKQRLFPLSIRVPARSHIVNVISA